jgi:Raf kinase inhibitor-like YbhB/YbcL family protein
MQLTSSAFAPMGKIPPKYTCDGTDISPPLEFHDIPAHAKSLVLIVVDPDIPLIAKKKFHIEVWDHWVVFNIPPRSLHLAEGKKPPGIQGKNTSGDNAYDSPCPPDKMHRYFFTLYALDIELNLAAGATRQQVEHAMQGHIMAKAELIGVYERAPQ